MHLLGAHGGAGGGSAGVSTLLLRGACLLALLGLCGVASLAPPFAAAARPVEKVRLSRHLVPLPDEVTQINACRWTREGSALLCIADVRDAGPRQVVRLRPDGSAYACITCQGGVPGGRRTHKLSLFPDGRRYLISTLPAGENNADEGASLVSSVAECAPSLLDCREVSYLPVALPEATGSLNDREVRLSPDGRKLVYTIVRNDGFLMLMGDLVREGEGYEVQSTRVLNAASGVTTAADFARRGAFAEAKSFSDGHTLIYASTEQAGSNLDVYRLDLATGASQRVSFNGEWDEDGEDDPRGRFLTIGTTRKNFNTLRGATVVPVPPFLDQVKTVFFARFKLANLEERRRALEAWLSDDATERAGLFGRQLSDLRGGWDARMPIVWNPDGTRVVFYEHGPGTATRLVVVRLRARKPAKPHCADPESEPACVTPTPMWAPLLTDYPALPPGIRLIPGPRGGQAIVTFGGIVIGGQMRIDYQGYTTADGLVLDGSEQINGVAFGGQRIDISGDVKVSGSQQGYARGQVFGVGRQACGTIEGQLGGRSERTVYGRNDPLCGFGPAPSCANRRDDDGDGLEDLTDAGCTSEEDTDEAGPPARCAARKTVRLRVPLRRGERVRRARVRVGRGRVRPARVVGHRRMVQVRLRGRPARRVRVAVTARTSRGRAVRVVRRVRSCRRPAF